MADDDIPQDLVQLKKAFWEADARCAELAEQPGADAELTAARAQRAQAVDALYAHPWWATMPNRYEADQKVTKAARAD